MFKNGSMHVLCDGWKSSLRCVSFPAGLFTLSACLHCRDFVLCFIGK